MSERIYLGGKHSDKYALVDDEDYEWLSQYKWHFNLRGYAVRTEYLGGGTKNKKTRMVYMHKLIVSKYNNLNPNDKVEADHVDSNKLNNVKSNLRACSHSQNNFNKGPQMNNTTGYKGVVLNKQRNKYLAQIKCGKHIFLGYFDNPEDAAKSYNDAALKYFGEFAWLNTLKKGDE